jgi:ribonuclease HI
MILEQTAENEWADVTIYTDGGCDPNPGTGGYGALVSCGSQARELSGGFKLTTNNRMEIFAAIAGLETLQSPCKVTLISDSRYLVDAMALGWAKRWRENGWWRTKKERSVNADLWERLLTLCERHRVTFEWVRGHAGHAQNELCDALAMQALKQPDLPADAGYEPRPAETLTLGITRERQPSLASSSPANVPRGTPEPNQAVTYQAEFNLH